MCAALVQAASVVWLVSAGFSGFQWVSVGFSGFQWVSVGFGGLWWVVVGCGGLWWVVVGFRPPVLVDVGLVTRDRRTRNKAAARCFFAPHSRTRSANNETPSNGETPRAARPPGPARPTTDLGSWRARWLSGTEKCLCSSVERNDSSPPPEKLTMVKVAATTIRTCLRTAYLPTRGPDGTFTSRLLGARRSMLVREKVVLDYWL